MSQPELNQSENNQLFKVLVFLFAFAAIVTILVGLGCLLGINNQIEPLIIDTPTPPAQKQITMFELTTPESIPVTILPVLPKVTNTLATTQTNLEEVRLALQNILTIRNPQQVQKAIDLLDTIDTTSPQVPHDVVTLRSKLYYALDLFNGTVYLNSTNMKQWIFSSPDGGRLTYPINMTINQNYIYILDSGLIYQGDLSMLPPENGQLIVTPILTSDILIGGYPIKEIVSIEATNTGETLFALDKSSDIYRYEISSGTWHLEKPLSSEYTQPSPLYLNLSSYDNRLYILDPARNQIWRHPPSSFGVEFLPGTLPWLVEPSEPDVSSGVDLTIDGNVYVLGRNGTVTAYNQQGEFARFSLTTTVASSHVVGWDSLPVRPIAIFGDQTGVSLYIADPGKQRVLSLDRRDGSFIRQFVAPDKPEFAALRDVVEDGQRLYMLAGNSLYGYNLSDTTLSLEGELPKLNNFYLTDISMTELLPNDPRLPFLLSRYKFVMPFTEAMLPDRSAIYPGSRRAYRYGVHEGLDLFPKDIGIEMKVSTPVQAVGDGIILRADTDYQEMMLVEINGLLEAATTNHKTPHDTLEKLNGRQVWIDHGLGVVSRYSHLSGIAQGIMKGQQVKAGQVIGYVGLSGTPDGITGNTTFVHLHFEIRFGPDYRYYLGQWLSIEETRHAFEQIFQVPVRPAYLEFREN